MVTAKPIQVQVTADHDAMAAIEAVHADGVPREIVRGGEVLAVILPHSRELLECGSTREMIEFTMAAARS